MLPPTVRGRVANYSGTVSLLCLFIVHICTDTSSRNEATTIAKRLREA
nr:MAG TPA: hypothetical protein [Caudoviricetes sp.]